MSSKKSLVDEKWIETFEQLAKASYDGYWDWYIQEDYEYMSPLFWRILGYEPEEKKHHPCEWQKHILPEDLEIVLENFDVHVKTKGKVPFKQEVRYVHKSGCIITVICRGLVIEWDVEDNPVRMIGTHTDVTELRKREEELKRKNEELKEFSYFASHDLKAPLRHICSYIDLLARSFGTTIPDEQNKLMGVIKDSAKEMGHLIKGLLELCYISTEKSVFQYFSVAKLMESLLNRYKESVTLTFQIGKVPKVYADPILLKQFLINVFTNAIKYKKEEVSLEICIGAKKEIGRWIFWISDNGKGIKKEDVGKVFRPFFRAKQNSKLSGAGIGLAICKKIIESHSGELWIESKNGKGTTIYFSLPNRQNIKD